MNKSANNNYDIHPLLEQRWSPRTFSHAAITDDEVMRLFEAARWAPSSNNIQPWRFIFARKGTDAYQRMYDLLAEFNQGWVDSPVLVFAAIKKTTPDGKDNYHALHDLGLAASLMTVQAQSMDIAVHQMAGFDHAKAAELYEIPDDYHFATAIAIGKYGGDPDELSDKLQEQEKAPRERKPLKDIVNEGTWSSNF